MVSLIFWSFKNVEENIIGTQDPSLSSRVASKADCWPGLFINFSLISVFKDVPSWSVYL